MSKPKIIPPIKIQTKDRILLASIILFIIAVSPIVIISYPVTFIIRRALARHKYYERLIAQGMIYERQE